MAEWINTSISLVEPPSCTRSCLRCTCTETSPFFLMIFIESFHRLQTLFHCKCNLEGNNLCLWYTSFTGKISMRSVRKWDYSMRSIWRITFVKKKNRRSILYDQLRIDQLTLRRIIFFYQCDLREVNVNSGNRYHIYNVFVSWFTSKGKVM